MGSNFRVNLENETGRRKVRRRTPPRDVLRTGTTGGGSPGTSCGPQWVYHPDQAYLSHRIIARTKSTTDILQLGLRCQGLTGSRYRNPRTRGRCACGNYTSEGAAGLRSPLALLHLAAAQEGKRNDVPAFYASNVYWDPKVVRLKRQKDST